MQCDMHEMNLCKLREKNDVCGLICLQEEETTERDHNRKLTEEETRQRETRGERGGEEVREEK